MKYDIFVILYLVTLFAVVA